MHELVDRLTSVTPDRMLARLRGAPVVIDDLEPEFARYAELVDVRVLASPVRTSAHQVHCPSADGELVRAPLHRVLTSLAPCCDEPSLSPALASTFDTFERYCRDDALMLSHGEAVLSVVRELTPMSPALLESFRGALDVTLLRQERWAEGPGSSVLGVLGASYRCAPDVAFFALENSPSSDELRTLSAGSTGAADHARRLLDELDAAGPDESHLVCGQLRDHAPGAWRRAAVFEAARLGPETFLVPGSLLDVLGMFFLVKSVTPLDDDAPAVVETAARLLDDDPTMAACDALEIARAL